MAISTTPADYVDPERVENYLSIARERGLDVEHVIRDMVASESPALAAAIRRAAGKSAPVNRAAPGKATA